jgi:hypothetical protein
VNREASTEAQLEAAMRKFEELDPGYAYYSEEYLNHPNCFELYKVAGEIVELSVQLMADRLPKRMFEIAYSCPPYEVIQEMADDAAAHRSFQSFLRRVSLMQPALFADGGEQIVRPVIGGLSDISHGGESPYVGKSAFKGQGNKLPFQVTVHRMMALDAYRAGRDFGIPASELQLKLSQAYGATFDTIRKWEASCRKVIDSTMVFDVLARSGEGHWRDLFEQGLAFAKLEDLGKQYQQVWRKARK